MAVRTISALVQRVRLALAALLLSVAIVAPANAGSGAPRYAAILVDPSTREVLYANAADELRHPASITKIMTLYLAFDALVEKRIRLTDPIVISRHAAAQKPSKLGLAPGQSLTLEEAIRIITVKSANDLAVAVAERIGGTEDNFARLMTRKARLLGMTNTTFTNASGLPDPGNVTSARDIATLSMALLRNHPSYYIYFGQRAYSYGNRSFANHNHLLGKMTGLDGIKTGYTADAGFALVEREGRRLIAVVLGEPSIAARNRDVTALLDAGFSVLDKREAGIPTSVAANLPTMNHPALRVAAMPGEQGSRNDVTTVRKRVATSSAAHRKTEAKGRRQEQHSAKSKSAKGKKESRSAGASSSKHKASTKSAKNQSSTSAKSKGKKSAAKATDKKRDRS
jgi:D-alanyl-D-alanine carboxypeptidase